MKLQKLKWSHNAKNAMNLHPPSPQARRKQIMGVLQIEYPALPW